MCNSLMSSKDHAIYLVLAVKLQTTDYTDFVCFDHCA